MQSNKISARPPAKKPIEEFILAAESKGNVHRQSLANTYLPWQENGVRKDVQKVFTAKLSEEYLMKIKFISDKTNKSQQKIIREIIYQEIDKLIDRLI